MAAKSEKEFMAEIDASTLAEANVIKKDPDRLKAARGVANKMAKEAEIRAQGMRSVASQRPIVERKSKPKPKPKPKPKQRTRSKPVNRLVKGL